MAAVGAVGVGRKKGGKASRPTIELFFLCVHQLVALQVARLEELFAAVLAGEGA